jgi:hypothetical protein
MIKIKPSPTADSRTCEVSMVSKETLLESSQMHIADVRVGLSFFAALLGQAADNHDTDKITCIDAFYADFQQRFEPPHTSWWDMHRKINRHHLNEPDGVPEDVNLIDVLDYIADCTMAGMARSGSVRPLTMTSELLMRAFENTCVLLKNQVVVQK